MLKPGAMTSDAEGGANYKFTEALMIDFSATDDPIHGN